MRSVAMREQDSGDDLLKATHTTQTNGNESKRIWWSETGVASSCAAAAHEGGFVLISWSLSADFRRPPWPCPRDRRTSWTFGRLCERRNRPRWWSRLGWASRLPSPETTLNYAPTPEHFHNKQEISSSSSKEQNTSRCLDNVEFLRIFPFDLLQPK